MAKQRRTRSSDARRNAGAPRRFRNVFAAVLPVIACFLAGGTEKWAEGIVLVLLGALVMFDPPRFSLGRVTNVVAISLIACALFAFLPARWFFLPAWRVGLVNDFGVALPTTLSPQPWVSLQYLVSFVAGLTWLYYVCGRDAESREIRFELRLFATGVVLLAALCVLLRLAHTTIPFWHNERKFGPFPNRNQTGDLLAITSVIVLACGADDLRNHKQRWIAWMAGLGVLIAAIVLNFSRAGILLLVAGVVIWLAITGLRRGTAVRIGIGISAVFVLLTVVLLFGGETLERFHLRSGGAGMTSDFRWLIFQDALQLIRSSPWCGIGFGNFEPVFAIFRAASSSDNRAHHPESDWFWLWCELGWIALALTIAGAAFLLWRAFPRDEGRNYRLRLAGFVAALLFALHGLFDVSAHRVGTAMAALFLLGTAMPRPLAVRATLSPFVFRFAAAILILVGVAWTASTRWQHPLPGSLGAEILRSRASAANRSQNFAEASEEATRALQWTPLDWQLYFVRALAEANQRHTQTALNDFRRARFLEPNAYEVPYDEGHVWLATEPALALTAWREALRRAGPLRAEAYGRMLSEAEQFNPRIVPRLHELSRAHTELVLTYLDRFRGDAFKAALDQFLSVDPDLATLSPDQRVQLLELWSERGDLAKLAAIVHKHAEWLPAASSGISKYRAEQGDFKGATELAMRFGVRPALPQISTREPVDELQRRLAADPANYAIGYSLYRQLRDAGRIDDALLAVRHFTSLPRAPEYFNFLEAECWGAKEDWERAWQAYQKFATAVVRR
jgi:O-antigen ligase